MDEREIKADRVGNRKVLVILHDFQRELWRIGWTRGGGGRNTIRYEFAYENDYALTEWTRCKVAGTLPGGVGPMRVWSAEGEADTSCEGSGLAMAGTVPVRISGCVAFQYVCLGKKIYEYFSG